ncbi:preprotein translocase subunit SecG [Alphaproteobacteria bacterium]|nr:preprotein translocase subunit SecG [Alphaproteobacteria bacterium]
MINLFLIVSAVIGAVLILIILFQKTEGGSLGLGTQTSLTGGMTANKSSFSVMTKITYAIGFGFLFWCLFMGAVITKQYSSSTDLDEIQDQIVIDESIEEQIPEVPNQ